MPRSATQDIAHEQVTDHRIQIPNAATLQGIGETKHAEELVAVRGKADARDLGIAYSQLAVRGDREAGDRAMKLLREAERDMNAAPNSLPDAIFTPNWVSSISSTATRWTRRGNIGWP